MNIFLVLLIFLEPLIIKIDNKIGIFLKIQILKWYSKIYQFTPCQNYVRFDLSCRPWLGLGPRLGSVEHGSASSCIQSRTVSFKTLCDRLQERFILFR